MTEERQHQFDIAEDDIRQRWRTCPPKEFPAKWASEWGFDKYGQWQSFEVKGVSHKMRYIPPGSFIMGSPYDEEDFFDCQWPQHKVTLTQGFWMGETTVTQALWAEIMDNNPSHFQADANEQLPVEQVSWHDCQQFCRKLSELTGATFSLPSEAQWEYACRAGTETAFSFGEVITPKYANYFDGPEYRNKTVDVYSFEANKWGLRQMHGNVWEWCQDDWRLAMAISGHRVDPLATGGEVVRAVLRGGGWYLSGYSCRSAYRIRYGRNDLATFIGLRVVQVIEPEA